MKALLSQLAASKRLRLALAILISLVSLYLALRNVSFAAVWSAILGADAFFIGLAVVSLAVNTVAKALRWQVLLGESGAHLPLLKLLLAFLAGQLLNLAYPARVGDLSRAYIVGGMGPGRVFTLGTVFVEKLLDTLAYSLLFVWLIVLMPLPAWVNGSVQAVVVALLAASFAVLVLAFRTAWVIRLLDWFVERMPAGVQNYLRGRLRSGIDSLESIKHPSSLGKLIFWTLLIWGTAILNNMLVLYALGLVLPWTASLLILLVLQAGISLPSVPGRIGIFEYSCVLALSAYGVEQAVGLSYGFVLHAVIFGPSILAGLLAFWLLGLDSRAVRQEVLLARRDPALGNVTSGTVERRD